MALFLNHYECSECGNAWEDEWSCACDDRCAVCNASIEPHQSDDITDEDDSISDLYIMGE